MLNTAFGHLSLNTSVFYDMEHVYVDPFTQKPMRNREKPREPS